MITVTSRKTFKAGKIVEIFPAYASYYQDVMLIFSDGSTHRLPKKAVEYSPVTGGYCWFVIDSDGKTEFLTNEEFGASYNVPGELDSEILSDTNP